MNQEKNEERIDLDRILGEMAQETPEMPADFHARWTEAVRAEAGQAKTEKKQEGRRQWRYILSAAAVFVFLIGGTLLTRSMDQKDQTNNVSIIEDAMVPSGNPESDTAAEAGGASALDANEAEEADFFEAVHEAAEAAGTTTAVPDQLAGALSAKTAKTADSSVKADMDSESDSDTAMVGAAEDAGAAVTENAAEPEPTMLPTMVPASEPAEEQPERTEEPAQESEIVSFLKDLGIFTLKALAAAAVIAAVIFGVKTARKAGKK